MFSASRNGNGRPARRFLPALEALEDRWCPSAFGHSHLLGDPGHHGPAHEARNGDENDQGNDNGQGQNDNNQGNRARGPRASVRFHGHTLQVKGTNGADTVSIQDDGQGNITVVVTRADGTTQTFTGTDIRNIIVNTRGGDDNVTFTQTGARSSSLHLFLNLGSGDDKANLDLSPGSTSGALNIGVLGGRGNDQVTAQFGALGSAGGAGGTGASGSDLFFSANLGRGDDTFTGTLAGNLLNDSSARFRVAGAGGDDTLSLTAAGVNLDPAARLAIDLSGGGGGDNITVNTSGTLNGALRVRAAGGSGKDTVAADLTSAAGSTGSLGAFVLGGRGDDTLTLNVAGPVGGGTGGGSFQALLDGGAGVDTCVSTPNVTVRNCEA
jgi:hypothetical protein